jgi:two-component system cell cycle response regulator
MNKVLVADDEESIRILMCKILVKEGYEVIEAADGKEAVELARRENPHVIIMDIRMPVMNGIEACRILKKDEKTRYIPILVVTAVGTSRMEAIAAGADDFLPKPFDHEEVSIRVKSMLRIGHLTNELQRIYMYVNELESQRKKS